MLTDLLRWHPADELRSIFEGFERRLSQWSRIAGEKLLPEMASADDRLRIRIPLAGMSKEDVEITSAGHTLRIRAFRKDDGGTAEYDQALTLPEYVDTSRVTATMKHGLLELSLPYEEARQPRKIEISSEGPKQISAAA